jgi:hypothetical protein
MSMMKVFFVIGTIALFIVWFAYLSTSRITHAADTFIGAVQKHELPSAHAMLIDDLAESTSEYKFEQMIKDLGLDKVASVSWSNRKIEENRGVVSGTATDAAGKQFPIKITFHCQGGYWKISSIDTGY